MEHLDAIVIGMGPGGELVAGRLLEADKNIAVVERELIGGECGYYACIPTKVLLRSPEAQLQAVGTAGVSRPQLDWAGLRSYRDGMIRHLDDSAQVSQLQDSGARVLRGQARLVGRNPWRVRVGEEELTADHVVVATGAESARPPIDGLDTLGSNTVWTNREATTLTRIPRRAVVVGGSAVGIELSQFLARLGTQVTVVQRGPRLLDREDPRLCQLIAEQFDREGIDVRLDTQAVSARQNGSGAMVVLDSGKRVPTDVIVLAAGRSPRGDQLALEEHGVALDGTALAVDEHCRAAPGLWGVGDVTGQALFTHVAKYQGRVVADNILGTDRRADYTAIPRVVFAHPEIAAVGRTEEQAHEQGLDPVATEVDLTEALARPWTYETDPQGHLGLVADRTEAVLVGAWAFGPLAAEWIHLAAFAIRAKIPLAVLQDAIVQFPTFSEGYLVALDQLDV